ncbi:MAG TPA: peptide chain release factor N(5)-glutamine methyltransferase [Gemmatimonadales bacterium]|nr:peptide chain release factor N(5)-glutamine methyltransferase [Gemmatimonadales bacterium]
MLERTVRSPAGGGTIADALGGAAELLAASGISDARREARALWAAVAGGDVTPGGVWLERNCPPAPDVARRFSEAVERRAGGAPFAYAVGTADFRTVRLGIDRRALIPRPETEGLVDLVIRRMTDNGKRRPGGIVADIGTGCGCIALSLAVEGCFDRVIGVERAAAAAALARENVAQIRPAVPVAICEGDLLAPLAGERLRAIVSNPPYLTETEYLELDPAVRSWEPRDALVSGPDGLEATRELLAGARALLEPGGFLAVEIDERRADAVRALARAYDWPQVAVYDDLFGRPRYLLASLEEDA